jgi:hypothetical protein
MDIEICRLELDVCGIQMLLSKPDHSKWYSSIFDLESDTSIWDNYVYFFQYMIITRFALYLQYVYRLKKYTIKSNEEVMQLINEKK